MYKRQDELPAGKFDLIGPEDSVSALNNPIPEESVIEEGSSVHSSSSFREAMLKAARARVRQRRIQSEIAEEEARIAELEARQSMSNASRSRSSKSEKEKRDRAAASVLLPEDAEADESGTPTISPKRARARLTRRLLRQFDRAVPVAQETSEVPLEEDCLLYTSPSPRD